MAADRHLRGQYSIRDTAMTYGVSWATVRNWVRVVSERPALRKEAQELADALSRDLNDLYDRVERARTLGLLGAEEYKTFLKQMASDEGVDDELMKRLMLATFVIDAP